MWMRNSRLNRTTVNIRMFCPPVYYQWYTSLTNTLYDRGKTRFCCDSLLFDTFFHFSFFVFLLCLFGYSACTTTTYCANVNANVCASGSRAREKRNDHNRKSHTCVAPLVSASLGSSARHYSKSTWNTYTHSSRGMNSAKSGIGSPRVCFN